MPGLVYLRADELQPGDVWREDSGGRGRRNGRALRFLTAERTAVPAVLRVRALDDETGEVEEIDFYRGNMQPVIGRDGDDDDDEED